MAEILCPMCGQTNSDELEICQHCQARLKPLSVDSPLIEDQDHHSDDETLFGDTDWLTRMRSDSDIDPLSDSPTPKEYSKEDDDSADDNWLERIRDLDTDDSSALETESTDSLDWVDSSAEPPAEKTDAAADTTGTSELFAESDQEKGERLEAVPGELPDWFSDLRKPADTLPDSEDETEALDWLDSADEPPTEKTDAVGETPDTSKLFAESDPEPGDWLEAEPADTPDWFSDSRKSADALPDSEEETESFDWLDSSDKPPAEKTDAVGETPDTSEIFAKSDPEPGDWLEAEPADTPDWFSDSRKSADALPDSEEETESFDWLDSSDKPPAEKTDAVGETLDTSEIFAKSDQEEGERLEAVPGELPDWFSDSGELSDTLPDSEDKTESLDWLDSSDEPPVEKTDAAGETPDTTGLFDDLDQELEAGLEADSDDTPDIFIDLDKTASTQPVSDDETESLDWLDSSDELPEEPTDAVGETPDTSEIFAESDQEEGERLEAVPGELPDWFSDLRKLSDTTPDSDDDTESLDWLDSSDEPSAEQIDSVGEIPDSNGLFADLDQELEAGLEADSDDTPDILIDLDKTADTLPDSDDETESLDWLDSSDELPEEPTDAVGETPGTSDVIPESEQETGERLEAVPGELPDWFSDLRKLSDTSPDSDDDTESLDWLDSSDEPSAPQTDAAVEDTDAIDVDAKSDPESVVELDTEPADISDLLNNIEKTSDKSPDSVFETGSLAWLDSFDEPPVQQTDDLEKTPDTSDLLAESDPESGIESDAEPADTSSDSVFETGSLDWLDSYDEPPAQQTDDLEKTPDTSDLPAESDPESGAKLDTDSAALPNWLDDLGKTTDIAPDTESETELPDWVDSAEEQPAHQEDAEEETPYTRDLMAKSDQETRESLESELGDIPEWLDDSKKPADAFPDSGGETGSLAWLDSSDEPSAQEPGLEPEAEPAEIPDWLSSLGKTPDISPDSEELPDQLDSTGEDAAQKTDSVEESRDTRELFAASDQESGFGLDTDSEDDTPDWLSDYGGETDEKLISEDESTLPDWLTREEPAASTPEQSPPSLSPDIESQDLLETPPPLPKTDDQPDQIRESEEIPDLDRESRPTTISTDMPIPKTSEDDGLYDALEIHEWMDSESTKEDKEDEEDQAETSSDELAPADMPQWLQAMRPVDTDAEKKPSFEGLGPTETSGPLAGLSGVLKAEPEMARVQSYPKYSAQLEISDEQLKNAAIFGKLIKHENIVQSVPSTPKMLPQRLLRWIIAALIFIGISFTIISSKQPGVPSYQGRVPVEVLAASQNINTLTQEDTVLVAFDYQPGTSGEINTAAAPVLDHIMLKGAKMAFIATSPTGPALAEQMLNTTLNQYHYLSGETYVNLGFIPGGASGLLGFAQIPQKITPLSFDGLNAWDTHPLENIHKLADFSLVLVITDNPDIARTWFEQIKPTLTETPFIAVVSAQAEPMIQPYYGDKNTQIQGIVSGILGGAAYEKTTGRVNLASKHWNALNLGIMSSIVVILLGSAFNGTKTLIERNQDQQTRRKNS